MFCTALVYRERSTIRLNRADIFVRTSFPRYPRGHLTVVLVNNKCIGVLNASVDPVEFLINDPMVIDAVQLIDGIAIEYRG